MASCGGCGSALRVDNRVGFCQGSRPCRQAARREWERQHPGNGNAARRFVRETEPERRLLAHAKERAKKLGIPFEITKADVLEVMTDICPALGVPLVVNKGHLGPWSYTLDRIDNSKGYVPGNIQILSYKANSMKRDATREELIQFARWALDQEGIAHE